MTQKMDYDQVIFQGYTVIDLISEDGQAMVAKAKDPKGNLVAIRQLLADPSDKNYEQELARFKRASQIRVNSHHVIQCIYFGEENAAWYAIYPWIEGGRLDHYVGRQGGRLSPSEATRLIVDIAAGLAACHARGIIHRDLKPGNILINHTGLVIIIDFGLCTILGQATVTQGNGFQGTLPWAAPEQLQSAYCQDSRLDLYSLGGIFYYLLTGLPPAVGTTDVERKRSIEKDTPTAPSDLDPSIPRHMSQACMRLLEKDPNRRFQSCNEFIADLNCSKGLVSQFCGVCGQALPADAHFCFHCGAGRNPQSILRCLGCGNNVTNQDKACPQGHRFSLADHRLEFIAGPTSGMVFRIPEGMHVVGRERLCPRDFWISTRHLCVGCSNGSVQVIDLGSTNGTFVNELPAVPGVLLAPGMELRIGGNKAVYQCSFQKGKNQ